MCGIVGYLGDKTAYNVLIKGKKAPTVGNICMDMSMVDISNIPEAREGDNYEILIGPSRQKLRLKEETSQIHSG